MRKVLLIVVILVMGVLIAPAGALVDPTDPFPAGACVRATVVDPRPVCVLVDPTD